MEVLQSKPGEVFHIGDNEISDYVQAKKQGIAAFKYELSTTNYYNVHNAYINKLNDIGIAHIQKMVADEFSLEKNKNTSYWYQIGFEYGGPLLYSFTDWILNDVHSIYPKVSDIVFVARDGYLVKK